MHGLKEEMHIFTKMQQSLELVELMENNSEFELIYQNQNQLLIWYAIMVQLIDATVCMSRHKR